MTQSIHFETAIIMGFFSIINFAFVTPKWENTSEPIELLTRSETFYFLTSIQTWSVTFYFSTSS